MKSLVNEVMLSWHEVGRGQPVVLVHGLGDDHRAWRKVLPGLMLRHKVLLYDLRGHGESEVGEPEGTLRQLSDDLVALMDAAAVPSCIVAGFSLGGTVAMRLAIDHPGRVEGLALVGTSSRVNSAAASWYEERADAVAKDDPLLREMLDRDTEDVYRQRPDEIAEGLLIRRQSTADPAGYANACRAMAALHDAPLDSELGMISAPTAILAGDADQHCPPRASKIIADGIAGSSLRVLAGCGHPIPVERPDEVVQAIERIAR